MLARILPMLVICICVSSCSFHDAEPPRKQSVEFAHAISVCRFQHTGATNKRRALPATEEHIAKCLERKGWLPSGKPAPLPVDAR
jgi:hypothetical protein